MKKKTKKDITDKERKTLEILANIFIDQYLSMSPEERKELANKVDTKTKKSGRKDKVSN